MDILTAISPVAAAAVPAATGESPVDSDTGAFAAALQQAAASESVTEPALPAPSISVADPVANTPADSLALTAQPAALALQDGAAPAAAEPAPEPLQVEQEALPEATVREEAEVDEGEVDPVPAHVPTAALDVAEEAGDSADDDTQPPADSLEAIRQRLDLIDTAGQMASGVIAAQPSVTWAQAPAASAETASGVDRDANALQWMETVTEAVNVEASQAMDSPAAFARVAEAVAQGTDSSTLDGQAPASSDWELNSLPGIPALVPAAAGSIASPGGAEVAPSTVATLGSDTWQADLGQQVIGMVRRGEQQVDMQLHPADLGPLSISLNVSESGIQAQFHSAHASVRAAVEQALPQLQGALAAQGLSLGETSVNDGAPRQAMGEQPRRESPGGHGEARQQQAAQASSPVQVAQVISAGAGVDLYL